MLRFLAVLALLAPAALVRADARQDPQDGRDHARLHRRRGALLLHRRQRRAAGLLGRAVPRGGRRRRGAAQAPGHEDPLGEAHDPEPHRRGAQEEVDLECSTTTWTLSRQQLVDFSLVTFVDGGSVLVGAESSAGRLQDLGGKRIAVIRGTTTEKALRGALRRTTSRPRWSRSKSATRAWRSCARRGSRPSPPTAPRSSAWW